MGALSIVSLLWRVASSRLGLAALAGGLCFVSGYHRAFHACDARQAAEQAAQFRAQLAEQARQARASTAIDAHDRQRAQALVGAVAAIQAEIDRLQAELLQSAEKEPRHVGPKAETKALAVNRCAIDGDFARRVRRLDAAGC